MKLLLKGLAAGSWTIFLVVALYGIDRAILGPVSPVGWQETANLKAVPRLAGRMVEPVYLPGALRWPPARILYQTQPESGWWLELKSRTGQTRAWLGSGGAPVPPDLQNVFGCITANSPLPCPESWSFHSLKQKDGLILRLLSSFPAEENARILKGLRDPG